MPLQKPRAHEIMAQKRTGLPARFPKEYNSWRSMRRRCNNPSDDSYKYAGALGIQVCFRWQNSFAAFLEDMGRAPSPKHSILRMDKKKNYEPGNCRWGTVKEQQLGTCKPNWHTHDGETLCMADWAKKTGIPSSTIQSRLGFGWTFAQAIERELR